MDMPTLAPPSLIRRCDCDDSVDEIRALVPAVVLTLREESEGAALWGGVGADASDDGGVDCVGGAVAGAFVTHIPEVVDGVCGIGATVVDVLVADGDVGFDADVVGGGGCVESGG